MRRATIAPRIEKSSPLGWKKPSSSSPWNCSSDGRTAVHGAAMQGYDDVISFLVAKGADLGIGDKDGFTALDVALGKAGGFGFSGREGVVREGTAALIRELTAASGPASAP